MYERPRPVPSATSGWRRAVAGQGLVPPTVGPHASCLKPEGPVIDRPTYRAFLGHAAQLLREHADVLDEINVFPVPDADTGANLAATAEAAAEAAAEASDDDVPSAASRAALRAAQGNAGTILSQVLAGFGQELDARDELDDDGLAAAFAQASQLVDRAIADPVEGTMLTAVRAAAEATADADGDVLDALVDAVGDAVAHTTDQLDELREAGVVDAGAYGFEIVCHALRATITDVPADVPQRGGQRVAAPDEDPAEGPRWEVQYIVTSPAPGAAAALRDALAELGESLHVVEADDVLRVHVHTEDTDAVVAAGEDHGQVEEVELTDLHEQVRRQSA